MQTRPLSIDGAFLVVPTVHRDDRGAFLEWFRADLFSDATGHPFTLAQANCSVSAAGTLRGVHYAEVPPGQAKYVTCVVGAVWDVVVDLRVGSPTFGRHEGVRLDDVGRAALYLGEGLGHAFLSLVDGTVVQYLCSTPYAPGREHGLHPLDAGIGIDWPAAGPADSPVAPRLSPKDDAAPSLADAADRGLLPTWDAVRAHRRSLTW